MKKQLFLDGVGLVGLGSAAWGIWQISQPAAFIAVGITLIAYAVRANQ